MKSIRKNNKTKKLINLKTINTKKNNDTNSIYLDKSLIDCKKFVNYANKKFVNDTIRGIQLKPGYIHEEMDAINKFSKKETAIPSDFRKSKMNSTDKKYYCNLKLRPLSESIVEYKKIKKTISPNAITYFTHYNMERPYLLYINNFNNKKEVNIYKFNYDKYEYNNTKDDWNKKYYVKFVKKYIVENVMVGKSPKNEMTIYSGNYGKKFNGNTILLYLGKDNNMYKYVFIMHKVIEFTINNKIKKFVSPIGNSDVPYPYALIIIIKFTYLLKILL